ncbi:MULTISPECIES: glycosyltransferase [Aestuariivivens]|uniref:glycosyltransferase n=1 Tax=Aestuariivivens TaxID=1820275 RepID=UPI001CBD8249|nr:MULTISPECIES: glycosyltransferase [Aestuariivivens]
MAKRIKILFTIPNFDTAGSGKVVYDLVKGLDKTIFVPEICCFHDKGEFFNEVAALGIKIHIFRFAQPYRPFLSLPFRILKIFRFFRKHQFDIIHSWHWSSDITEPLAAKLAGIPFIYTKKAMGWGNKAWQWRTQLSTQVIAINTDMVNTFLKPFNYKVVYMPLGVDINYFKPQPPSETLKSTLNIKDSDFVIVSVANLVPVKGIEVLLEAVNLLNDESIKVLIIGDYHNTYGHDLKHKYKGSNVQFLGRHQDVRSYLALASIFVIPTLDIGRKEGLPIAPMEAMAMEKIVIGSKISGIVDILKPFDFCLFEAGNVTSLIKIINKVIDMTSNERESLEETMRISAVQYFNINQCVLNHQTLYTKLLKL